MNPPEKPGPFDCCGGGCHPCVYDLYYEELQRYQEWLNQKEDAAGGSEPPDESDEGRTVRTSRP